MDLNALSTVNTTGTKGSAAQPGTAAKEMGKDAFLRLLVSQLQHQDPLNPADSTEFTAQLAQFSSLEQLANIHDALAELKLYQASINNAQSVSFIGREIEFQGDRVELEAGRPVNLEFELQGAARQASVSLYDASGHFVRDFALEGLAAGRQTVSWDGSDRNGSPVPAGVYRFEVQAQGAKGEPVAVTPFARGRVSGVLFENGITYLTVGLRKVAVGEVTRITDAVERSDAAERTTQEEAS